MGLACLIILLNLLLVAHSSTHLAAFTKQVLHMTDNVLQPLVIANTQIAWR